MDDPITCVERCRIVIDNNILRTLESYKMRHAGLFLTLLIFITIFFNLFINASSNIVEIIMFPGNYLFSRLYSKIESRRVSEEILNSVLQSVQRNPFFIVEDKNVEDKGIGIYYGIILRETNRNFTVLTRDNNIDENYLVVNEEGILLGFVEKFIQTIF